MSALGDRALDPSPLLGALEGAVPGSSALVSLDGDLGQLEARIGRNLRGLAPAMRWLLDHRPGPDGARAICHGDFHPQNLLFDGREITAVLDWPNVLVADPAYDVAVTRMILEQAPLEVLPVSRPARWAVRRAGACSSRCTCAGTVVVGRSPHARSRTTRRWRACAGWSAQPSTAPALGRRPTRPMPRASEIGRRPASQT